MWPAVDIVLNVHITMTLNLNSQCSEVYKINGLGLAVILI